ncbi:MAG: sigma-70 family RNA polymerase sigma factor [bacterium]|nr:sigma-70 family RNA polymerase sigma factor [bacterium]
METRHQEHQDPSEHSDLDIATAAAVYVEHSAELSRFLFGVLRDSHLVSDVLQTAFTRLVEKGGATNSNGRKSWLFKVAFNEAMAIKRRASTGQRAARNKHEMLPTTADPSDHPVLRNESIARVQRAIADLSPKQREIVRMRIYEEMTFAEIAESLDITIGVAIGRMHAATKKLKTWLAEE